MTDKIEMGKRYVTREKGYPARILCVDRKDKHYPVIAAVENEDGGEAAFYYTATGKKYSSAGDPRSSPYDLIPAPPKMRKLWLNIYLSKKRGYYYDGCAYFSEAEARNDISGTPGETVTTVCVEVPEDEK